MLVKLASTKRPGNNRTIIHETISSPSTKTALVATCEAQKEGLMKPLIKYLTDAFIPSREAENALVRKRAAKYSMVA